MPHLVVFCILFDKRCSLESGIIFFPPGHMSSAVLISFTTDFKQSSDNPSNPDEICEGPTEPTVDVLLAGFARQLEFVNPK